MGEALPPVLHIEDLRFGYGRALLDVPQLALAAGQAALVVGPSGSGKSTLLHLIAGLITPQAGQLRVAGQDWQALAPAARDHFRGRTLGIVFQRLHLLPALTALDNLLLAQRLAGKAVDRPAALALLARLGLAAQAQQRPHTLSFGQAQRLAIARAVQHGPRLILADEPTSALDDAHAAEAIELLRSTAAACGAALLVVTHDQRLRAALPVALDLGLTAQGGA